MKLIKKITLLILVCALFVSKNTFVVVNASENTTSDVATFSGTITPTRSFYEGEYVYYYDFIIDGKFIDNSTGYEIPKSEWKIYASEPIKESKFKLELIHLPSITENKYNNIPYVIDVEVFDFNSKLTSSLKNGNNVNMTSNDINDTEILFYNSLGKRIYGSIYYSYSSKNTVLYSFVPDRQYLDAESSNYKYDIYSGWFTVDSLDIPILSINNLTLKEMQAYDINIKNKIKGSKHHWYSDDNTNVSVNNKGVVKAESLGSATIYCKVELPTGDTILLKTYINVE